ncbi:hypothetical protein [Pseudomonas oryziphila]|nr:hypothetical protein [Pseudomonas oryziphila]
MNYLKNLVRKLLGKPEPKTPEEIRSEQIDDYLEALEDWADMYKRM